MGSNPGFEGHLAVVADLEFEQSVGLDDVGVVRYVGCWYCIDRFHKRIVFSPKCFMQTVSRKPLGWIPKKGAVSEMVEHGNDYFIFVGV